MVVMMILPSSFDLDDSSSPLSFHEIVIEDSMFVQIISL